MSTAADNRFYREKLGPLHVFSGECDKGEVGIDIGHQDYSGAPLSTGDIVLIGHRDYIGTDAETLTYSAPLSVIVVDQKDGKPFVMGIKDCGFSSEEWVVLLVKKFSDVVDGERWPAWGFNYRAGAAA